MSVQTYLVFTVGFVVAHVVAYMAAGAVVLRLIYQPYWGGETPLFEPFLRMQSNPQEWAHTMRWLLPAQLLRGTLMAVVLFPVLGLLPELSFGLRFLFVAGLLYVYADLSSHVPFPSTIEGWLYMKERFVKGHFAKFQVEALLYSVPVALVASWLAG